MKWDSAEKTELLQLLDYNTFLDKGKNAPIPAGYKKIRVHMVYDVKHDGRHKTRLVADGHLTEIPLDSVYSSVVSLRGLRLTIFLGSSTDWTRGKFLKRLVACLAVQRAKLSLFLSTTMI